MNTHRTGPRLVSYTFPTPVGPMTGVACIHTETPAPAGVSALMPDPRDGLVLFEFTDNGSFTKEQEQVEKHYGQKVQACTDEKQLPALLRELRRQIDEYFAGERREFTLPLLPVGTPFQKEVWQAMLKIPYGTTCSYRQEAVMAGRDVRSVRAVARANGANRLPILIPCHRVIGADGSLTGYSSGLDKKKALLELERKHSLG